MSKIIGIDLGTTNAGRRGHAGRRTGGHPKPGRCSNDAFRVAITKTGERLVGQVAKRQAVTKPGKYGVFDQEVHGRRYDEVGEESRRVPYKVVKDSTTMRA